MRDAATVNASPGAVALDASGIVIAAGPVDAVLRKTGSDIVRIEATDRLLLPGLVNAHAHLDLTHIGHQPYGGDFVQWVRMVMGGRTSDPQQIHEAVASGAEQSAAAGVFTVGDVGSRSLGGLPVRGVGFVEVIGHHDTVVSIDGATGVQPHAPYSTGPGVYRQAAASGLPVSTHLAETPAELEFVARGTGPFRELLERLGKWNDTIAAHYGRGLHPVDWLDHVAGDAPWLCAHCNYVDDAQIDTIAKRGWSVAYCPRASDYFEHEGHRYRNMLAAGVNVCLGTDSIICHGTLSILDEMRHLYQRDKTDPQTLLKMATINGMRGLQFDGREATFAPGARSGVIAVAYDPSTKIDPLRQILSAKQTPVIEPLEGVT
ncbi:amidohydrolase family protein [Planctomycetales bacterium ZRK34]|nr:amidohydrolase family protein [Planctomycetales bacterium ZRK34]